MGCEEGRLSGVVLEVFPSEQQLEGTLIFASTELAPIVGQHATYG